MMIDSRSLACGLAASVLATCSVVSWGAGPGPRASAVQPPPKPDVNIPVVVEPGVSKKQMPEKAHGHLARKGSGNGQREGPDDPGPPHGETGNGKGGH
jgi:hypothetical protein